MGTRVRLLALMVCLLALSGCGRKEEEPAATQIPAAGDTGAVGETVAAGETVATVEPGAAGGSATPAAASPVTSDADISTGCWTADQRVPEAQTPGHRQWSAPPTMVIDPTRRYTATLETSLGAIEVELLPAEAPVSVNNFVCLARAGYYDGTVFHRVVPGFVIQGGDPTATGTSGPGYQFPDEPVARPYETGSLAMANSGPNSNGSQFFIVIEGGAGSLQPLYNHFGRVIAGQEIAEQIGTLDTGETQERVTLEQVTITEG
jgi:cyclophilin family peptidyl-prolyl cis-trans isomerase